MYSGWSFLLWAVLSLGLLSCGASTECASYLPASVAEMRRATGSGCFELQGVVVVARTPSTSAPRVYVQDQGGGPYSAIRAKCDQSPTHACPSETAGRVGRLLDGSQVTIRGYYLQGSLSEFEEIYLVEVVDEHKLAPVPLPASRSLLELSRDARARAQWVQVVSSDVPAQDPLVMYDFSPAEFARSSVCPAFNGFAVIQASVLGAATTDECASGSNPTGIAAADGRELLIGREFFKEFFASTDCACAAASKQHLLNAASALVGPIRGVLTPELRPGSVALHQVFHPLSKANFPITGG